MGQLQVFKANTCIGVLVDPGVVLNRTNTTTGFDIQPNAHGTLMEVGFTI